LGRIFTAAHLALRPVRHPLKGANEPTNNTRLFRDTLEKCKDSDDQNLMNG